jgi:hypothetical protein
MKTQFGSPYKYFLATMLLFCISWGLYACDSDGYDDLQNQTPATFLTDSITATKTTPEIQNTITPSLTKTATLIPPTITPTPSKTATLIPPTLTPIPTLPPDQAQAMVFDLLMNNAGCELPCYWGITPGKTSSQEAHNFLASIAEGLEQRVMVQTANDGSEQSVTVIVIRNTIRGYDTPISSVYRVINDVIETIVAFEAGTELGYQLHQVLGRYGVPDEVLLLLSDVSPAGTPWFSMWIIYEERGTTLYYSGAAHLKGDALQVCPSGIGPIISLIKPGSLTLQQMKREINDGRLYPSINDLPGKNIEMFYETLKEPDSCISFDLVESN